MNSSSVAEYITATAIRSSLLVQVFRNQPDTIAREKEIYCDFYQLILFRIYIIINIIIATIIVRITIVVDTSPRTKEAVEIRTH